MEKNDRLQEFAVKYKIGLFLALIITIGWIFWIQIVLGLWPSEFVLVPSTLGALSPLVTLKILEKLTDGEVNLDRILSSAQDWREKLPWLGLAAISFPIMVLLSNSLGFALGHIPQFFVLPPSIFDDIGLGALAVIPIHFTASLITSPLFEEPGWRGFALGELQKRLRREGGSLAIGTYWWL